jgi:hypothetical protein
MSFTAIDDDALECLRSCDLRALELQWSVMKNIFYRTIRWSDAELRELANVHDRPAVRAALPYHAEALTIAAALRRAAPQLFDQPHTLAAQQLIGRRVTAARMRNPLAAVGALTGLPSSPLMRLASRFGNDASGGQIPIFWTLPSYVYVGGDHSRDRAGRQFYWLRLLITNWKLIRAFQALRPE